jgi:regulator of replication initiation timing
LIHDHDTQKVNGFSHASCNPRAMKNRIETLISENETLKTENETLKAELEQYRQQETQQFRMTA